jgi:hypothetical protein
MDTFDRDVRAGFASVLQSITAGICDLYEVNEDDVQRLKVDALDVMPDGAHQFLAILYVLKELLLEQDAEFSADLLGEMVLRIQPVIFRHLGIIMVKRDMLDDLMKDDNGGLVN